MYGSRVREQQRVVVRKRERSATDAMEHVKRAYMSMCAKRKSVPQMEENLVDIKRRMLLCKGASGIREYQNLHRELKLLQEEVAEIKSGDDARAYFERARPLMETNETSVIEDADLEQKREAIAMALFHPEKAVPVFIQTDRCVHCQFDLKTKADESLVVCPGCHQTFRFLQLATDHVDVDFVAQDNHANHTRSTCTGNVDHSLDVDTPYPKPPHFHKYLMQFMEHIPDPPDSVIEVVLHELSKVHITHSSKVQSTPIGNILRKRKLKEWSWMSLRIAMMLKRKPGQPMPVFSEALIARMEHRFECLIAMLIKSKSRSKKKVFNFKFLTKIFLIQENEHAMSELFENHKTRAVLRREDKRIGDACARLQAEMEENGLDWKFFRAL